MGYNRQTFVDITSTTEGTLIKAEHFQHIEDGILANEGAISAKQEALKSGVNIKTINGISLLGSGDIVVGDGSAEDNSVIVYTDDAATWERKTTSSSGVESTTGISQSNIMHTTRFENTVYLVPKGNIIYALITYDSDGNFKARSSWYTEEDGTKELTDENPFNLVVGTGETSDIAVEEVLTRFVLQNVDPAEIESEVTPENMTAIQAKIKYLNYIQCCDIADKMVHFSCDDTYACLYDLIQNGGGYTSIFDNSFFASLKTCHDATGACFTLNTFNTQTTVPEYDISNVPSTFQSEFQENKSWLRFAFHAEDETTYCGNITAEAALASYNKFVAAIYQLTGDYDCIDPITRLGFFSGSLENVLLLKNAEHGIIGLLSADDARTSYYLTKEESEIARLKGKYYDLENELIFIKTLYRGWSTAKADLEANPMFRKTTELFWHEYEDASSVRPWITEAANYCNTLGYIHGFPADLYKPVV